MIIKKHHMDNYRPVDGIYRPKRIFTPKFIVGTVTTVYGNEWSKK